MFKKIKNELDLVKDMEAAVLEMMKRMNEKQKTYFQMEYNSRRKDEGTALILTALGCLGIGGVQRFYLGQMALGLLYLLTAGLLFIGTIYDLVTIKNKVAETNKVIAYQIKEEMEVQGIGKK